MSTSSFKDSADILKLITEAQNGNSRAESKLINIYDPYVDYMVSMYSKKTLIKDDDDLRSYVYIGLLEGIRRFDPTKNTRFIYFAHIWMKKHIFIGESDYNLIRIPANQKIFYEKFLKEHEDINKEVLQNLKRGDVVRFINIKNTKPKSLSNIKDFHNDKGLLHIDEEKENTELLRYNINKALSQFEENDIFIIEHTFGLNGKAILNIEEMSEDLNVSKVYISAVKTKIIKLLRHSSFYNILFKGL